MEPSPQMSFSPEHGKTPAGGIGIPKDMQQGTVFPQTMSLMVHNESGALH